MTDEEFELIKDVPFNLVKAKGWKRLKAYADSLKNDVRVRDARIDLNAEVIKQNIALKEENSKIKEQLLSKQHRHHESIQGVGRYVCKFYKY